MTVPRFIIDTDGGVDDAGALFMACEAHKRKDIHIIGITTVFGNTEVEYVIRNVNRVLIAANCQEIPVFRGSSESLVVHVENTINYHGRDGFNDVKFNDEIPLKISVETESAPHAIQRLVKENKHQVTLVTMGPLTNIALALKSEMSCNLSSYIQRIVTMGGNCESVGNTGICSEFNFHCDPEAAFIVMDKVKCPTYLVCWELCIKDSSVQLKWLENILHARNTPATKIMKKIYKPLIDKLRRGGQETSTLCDQLTMLVALEPNSILASSSQMATIELNGYQTRGQTVLERRRFRIGSNDFHPNITLVDKVDTKLFKKVLLDAYGHNHNEQIMDIVH